MNLVYVSIFIYSHAAFTKWKKANRISVRAFASRKDTNEKMHLFSRAEDNYWKKKLTIKLSVEFFILMIARTYKQQQQQVPELVILTAMQFFFIIESFAVFCTVKYTSRQRKTHNAYNKLHLSVHKQFLC